MVAEQERLRGGREVHEQEQEREQHHREERLERRDCHVDADAATIPKTMMECAWTSRVAAPKP